MAVDIKEEEKFAQVVVPDDQLSLAIGKSGQNARLAARLTNWKIDIKSETQFREMIIKSQESDKKKQRKKQKPNKNKKQTYNKGGTNIWKINQLEHVWDVMKKSKNDLIRIVKNKNDEINIDRTGKLDGRGAYICDNIQCLEKIIKSKRLEKIFDKEISNEIYEKLRGVILDK